MRRAHSRNDPLELNPRLSFICPSGASRGTIAETLVRLGAQSTVNNCFKLILLFLLAYRRSKPLQPTSTATKLRALTPEICTFCGYFRRFDHNYYNCNS